MEGFDKILREIKSVEIQGAENIAKAGIQAILLQPDKRSAKKLINTRPTEPFLQNSIKIILKSKNKKKTAEALLRYIKKSEDKISRFGVTLVKNNTNVFTHCHSSTVISILKLAHKKGKKFVVYNTETRPLLQGRKTAEELAKAGIKVVHVPDTAAELALKQCDLFLFGADAFLKKGVVNKVETEMLCEQAKLHNIPRYSCGISLKYAKKIKIESRPAKEVWDERNKNIRIENPAFDLTPKKEISGVVSELGILHYKQFIKQSKKNLKIFLK